MNIAGLTRMRWLLSSLLIASAALFAVGVATERDSHDAGTSVETDEHNESEESSETGEEIFGINLESTPLVVLAVGISVVLAAATWRSNRKFVLLVTALFAASFAALDFAELLHQIEESATNVAIIAGTLAVLHAAAALLAEQRRAASRD